MTRQLTLVHTSDIHLGSGYGDQGVDALQAVLHTAEAEDAHILLLAGDIFDNNRVPRDLVHEVAQMLAATGRETVVLPGNHDCLTPDSVYREACFTGLPNVHIIGLTTEDTAVFAEYDLEVWGRAHVDYEDMSPLDPSPARAATRWHIGMAHGHFVRDRDDEMRSYLIRSDHLERLSFDYLALGHWDVWTPLDHTGSAAYYSGSPHLAKSVNVVHLDVEVGVRVSRRELVDVPARASR
jgi:DNA repair exonuclease SbcCD nuclease subunit